MKDRVYWARRRGEAWAVAPAAMDAAEWRDVASLAERRRLGSPQIRQAAVIVLDGQTLHVYRLDTGLLCVDEDDLEDFFDPVGAGERHAARVLASLMPPARRAGEGDGTP